MGLEEAFEFCYSEVIFIHQHISEYPSDDLTLSVFLLESFINLFTYAVVCDVRGSVTYLAPTYPELFPLEIGKILKGDQPLWVVAWYKIYMSLVIWQATSLDRVNY